MKLFGRINVARYRLFLFPLGSFLLIVLLTVFVLRPQLGRVFRLRQEGQEKKENLAVMTQKLAILGGYEEKELEEEVKLAFLLLPPKKDLPLILTMIKEVVDKSGLALKGIEIDNSSHQGAGSGVKFKVAVIGKNQDFYQFLEQLKNTAPLTRVKKIVLEQKGEGVVEAELVLNSFYFPSQVKEKEDLSSQRRIRKMTAEEEVLWAEFKKYHFPSPPLVQPPVFFERENPFQL